MKRQSFSLLPLLASLVMSSVFAQQTEEVQPADLGLKAAIPVDPDITLGEFENGVNYYIKVNKKPENRAALWLAVDAGSVLEDDNQLGLAHLTEHMGFNGTQHFAKQELIDYLESIGMRFGPEINAYTSFDETIYFLHVPTDSAYYVEKGFQILEDWAHLVSFEADEIDKERGVVIEEWRLGRGAWMRMLDKQLPIMFKDSRYAQRLPIGKKEILESCSHETLRKYYQDWYRPDLTAIVAVGDFDKEWILNLMKKHFASIPPAKNPRKREIYPVPDHHEALFAIATDKEADGAQVGIYFKSEAQLKKTVADYRIVLMKSLYNNMFNNRLNELTQKADPPFLYGYSGQGRFVRTKEIYSLGAGVKEDGIARGLEALLTEALRLKKFGFTASEFERTKTEILRNTERAYKERDKTESDRLAQNYVYNFLSGEPIPSPEQALALCQQLLPGIQLGEVNALAQQWITDNNRVVLVSAPEKEEVSIPTAANLLSVFSAAEKKDIQPYKDTVSDEPLVAHPPEPASIVEEKTQNELGITELKLANGVHVILKPTDFKNDEILFDAYSFGGTSLISDNKFMSAQTAASIIQESGAGGFGKIELDKKLTGRIVNVNPYISDLSEGIRGSASPQDIETMFQLIHLYITAPRKDEEAFKSYLTRMQGFIENRSADPETAFNDTIQVTLAQYHPRSRPWTKALLHEIDYAAAFDFYRDRFADASDFHFFFVGNFAITKIKPFIQTYLGGLPSLKRTESWKDTGVFPPKGVIQKVVYRGVEPKSMVRLVFTGPYGAGFKNYYALSSLTDVLRIKLREILREEMGGTYGVWIWPNAKEYPRKEYELHLMFGCAPERVNEMTQTLFQQIDSLKTAGPTELDITKVRETQIREQEVNLKENEFWLNGLRWKHYYREDLMDILKYPDYVATLSAAMIKVAAKTYLNTGNYLQVVLYPEAGKASTLKDN